MMKYIVASLLLASFVLADNVIPFQQCTDGTEPPIQIRSDICSSNPCKLEPFQTVVTTIDFTNPTKTATLTPEVDLYFGSQLFGRYELPEDKQNGCNLLEGSACPIDAGEDVTFKLPMGVPDVPATQVGVVFRLRNDAGKALFCMRIDLDVKR